MRMRSCVGIENSGSRKNEQISVSVSYIASGARLALRGITIGQILPLNDDLIGHEFGVVPNAPNEARPPTRLVRQPEEVKTGLTRNAALMPWLAIHLEGVDLHPTVVGHVAGCPDDR